MISTTILLGLCLNNLFLDNEFIYTIFEMAYEPLEWMIANGTDVESTIVPPIPSVFDADYYLFRYM